MSRLFSYWGIGVKRIPLSTVRPSRHCAAPMDFCPSALRLRQDPPSALKPEPLRTTLPRPVNPTPQSLEVRLQEVRGRIAAAERLSGRPPGSATLIGVVKTLPGEVIAEVVELGLADLGENRVQEAELHQQSVGRDAAWWQMIGHLQRNKVGKALALFDFVHGIDDYELAEAFSRRAAAEHRRVAILLEVNVSGEESKFGAEPEAVPGLLERILELEGIEVRGLMTVGAPVETSELARPGFIRLRKTRDAAERRLGIALPELSMGMSGDYEVAVEEGSTLVRVGTAIFGSRQA